MVNDPLSEIISRLDRAKETSRGQWESRCPAHDDSRASLSIRRGDDGRVLLHCHAGCSPMAVCSSVGLRLASLFPPKSEKATTAGKLIATYDYVDNAGELLFQVCRFTPKDFRQRKPDGKGGWIWNIDGVRRVLYRLPDLISADPSATILIVEGEKDADNLAKLGLVATCNSGGAGKWALTDSTPLIGRDVVIIIDKDTKPNKQGAFAGYAHAVEVAESLKGIAASVHMLSLPGDAVKDASDWISAGGTAEQLSELIASAPETIEAPKPVEPPAKPSAVTPLSGEPAPGTIDATTGRLILSTKRTWPTAESFVREFYSHADGPTILHYSGMFVGWTGSRYVEIEDGKLYHQVLPWLHGAVQMKYDADAEEWNADDFPANPTTARAAIDSTKALSHLDEKTPSPSWIGEAPDDMNPRWIIPAKSSMLYLPTMKQIPSTPKYFAVNAIDYDYNADAPAPSAWLDFLSKIFDDDLQSWDLLQEWFGYCLTGDTSQQKMLLIVGPKRSGKGTIARVLTKLIGDGNVCGPTTSSLAETFGLSPLVGKSLAIVSDARFHGDNIQTVVERLLCISGEDSVSIDRKYKNSVTMKLPTRLMFLTNEIPQMSDASGALAGRFVLMRLTRSFYGKEDPRLLDKLLAELPGILNWAIEGWKRLNARARFVQPESASESMKDMEDLASPVGAFIRDCCELGEDKSAWVDDLYKAWREWCEKDGRTAVTTKQRFGRDLHSSASNLRCRHSGGVRYYEGIAIKPGDGVMF